MLAYILKLVICSGVLYGYYWLALRNKVFHSYNRFYLLAAVVASLLFPLIKFHFVQAPEATNTGATQLLEAVSYGNEYFDEVSETSTSIGNTFTAIQVIYVLYAGVSLFFFWIFIKSLLYIFGLLNKFPYKQANDIVMVNTENIKGTPFSFFKFIFWNNAIDLFSDDGKRIFVHEHTHVQQKHSYDKLVMNVLLLVTWFNPFFWLIKKELNLIHEFEADRKAVENGNHPAFAAMILKAAYPNNALNLTNPFFYHSIKRRLKMLSKNQNPKMNYVSRLLVLPLAALLLMVFSFKTSQTHLYSGKKIVVAIDAGHGGKDNGAMVNEMSEKDITLAIVKKIKSLNENSHIEIVLTREDDTYYSPKERMEIAEKNAVDIFVSVHINADKGHEKTGLTVFVPPAAMKNHPQSTKLAFAFLSTFSQSAFLNTPDRPEQRAVAAWILKASKVPTILIETGNMNNEKDLAFITSESGQESIAKAILNGIENYLVGSEDKVVPACTINLLPTEKQWEEAAEKANVKTVNDTIFFERTEGLAKTYEGVEIKRAYVRPKDSKVVIELNNGTVKVFTQKEAFRLKIIPPPPPPPPLPPAPPAQVPKTPALAPLPPQAPIPPLPPAPPVPAIKLHKDVKEKRLTVVNGKKLDLSEKMAFFQADKIINKELKPEDAFVKYGSEATDGAIEMQVENGFSLTVQNIKVFFIGVLNPIELSSYGFDTNEISLQLSKGKLEGKESSYTAAFTKPESTNLIITRKKDGKQLGVLKFDVKFLPEPISKVVS